MRRARNSRSAAPRGFTLIELLVALTLFGLLTLVLFGGLRFGVRAWEAAETRSGEISEIDAVQGFLRRQIGQMVLPGEGPVAELIDLSDAFLAEPERLRFVAPVPPQIGIGGHYRFELELVDDPAGPEPGRRLDLTWRLYRSDAEIPDEPGEEDLLAGRKTLLSGVETAEFAYFGRLDGETEGVWRDRWEEPRLPALVALRVAFGRDDGRVWPELRVAPRLGGGES